MQEKRKTEFNGGIWDLPQYDAPSTQNKKLPVQNNEQKNQGVKLWK